MNVVFRKTCCIIITIWGVGIVGFTLASPMGTDGVEEEKGEFQQEGIEI